MTSLSVHPIDLSDLRTAFSGDLAVPGEAGYDAARHPWNLAVDQRPALVALPRTAADVAAAVRFAAQRGLRIATQAVGHGAARIASLDQAILLRTDAMRAVTVDAERRIARVEAGARWSDLAAASTPFGLSGLGGSVADVSVVAYALGGGIGWLSRAHGLCCHSVAAIELVTPELGWIRCDSTHHPELFWALRGGGGDLGVVTAMEIALVAVPELFGGTMLWPWERATEVLRAWRRWTAVVPDAVSSAARLLQVPPIDAAPAALRGRSFVTIGGAVLGSPAQADALLAPLRELEPEIDLFAPVSPEGLVGLHLEPEEPLPVHSTHALLEHLTPDALDALVAVAGPESGSRLISVELRHLGGALARERFGALPRLDGEYLLFAVGMAADHDQAVLAVEQLAGVRDAVSPVASRLEYLNFGQAPGQLGRSLPPATLDALARCRARTDPDGIIERT